MHIHRKLLNSVLQNNVDISLSIFVPLHTVYCTCIHYSSFQSILKECSNYFVCTTELCKTNLHNFYPFSNHLSCVSSWWCWSLQQNLEGLRQSEQTALHYRTHALTEIYAYSCHSFLYNTLWKSISVIYGSDDWP